MKSLVTVVVAAVVGAAVSWLVAWGVLGAADPAERYLSANQDVIARLVLEDVEKYGLDVYRLYLETSQRMPGLPEADFGADKAFRKLQVTYPDSNAFRFAESLTVYGAIRKRDMMQIENYLVRCDDDARCPRLMPSGYEIVPQLVAAQYNYYFHVGKLDEAEKTLGYLLAKFSGSWLFQPQGKPLAVSAFVASQRSVLATVCRKEVK